MQNLELVIVYMEAAKREITFAKLARRLDNLNPHRPIDYSADESLRRAKRYLQIASQLNNEAGQ